MKEFIYAWRKTLTLCQNIIFPATFFCIAILLFYGLSTFSHEKLISLHISFYIFSSLSLLTLLYFNRQKLCFYIISIIICYILINLLKNISTIPNNIIQNIFVLLPLNLLIFSQAPNYKLLSKISLYMLIFIFIEYSIIEKLLINSNLNISLLDSSSYFLSLSFILFIILNIVSLTQAIIQGTLISYAIFFSNLSIFIGIFYYGSATALALFFSLSVFLIFTSLCIDIYINTYQDTLTTLMTRKAFVNQSSKFPLKYTIGLVSIDDYDKLAYMFGKKRRNEIVKLIAQKLKSVEPDELLYRYSPDQFIIIFKNEIKKDAYKRMENIRRQIAASSFELSGQKKTTKITISGCVSEKKRSDANAIEVLVRANKTLQKALTFSHNLTSQA